MGIRSSPKLDPSSIIVRMLIDMYVEIGDQIALQYGGSEAHKKVASATSAASNVPGQLGKVRPCFFFFRPFGFNWFHACLCNTLLRVGFRPTQHKELLTSIRRYYSNAFTDRLKQDAMNLFLGYYLPSQHNTPLCR